MTRCPLTSAIARKLQHVELAIFQRKQPALIIVQYHRQILRHVVASPRCNGVG